MSERCCGSIDRNLLRPDPGDPRRLARRRAGQIVTVLGANGAGKTTVLRTVSGVLDPERGRVIFEGERHRPHAARPGDAAGHVPRAGGREIFPFLTVRENLMMGAYTRRDTAGIASDLDSASTISRACRSASTSAPACCRAASSRCWRSAGR